MVKGIRCAARGAMTIQILSGAPAVHSLDSRDCSLSRGARPAPTLQSICRLYGTLYKAPPLLYSVFYIFFVRRQQERRRGEKKKVFLSSTQSGGEERKKKIFREYPQRAAEQARKKKKKAAGEKPGRGEWKLGERGGLKGSQRGRIALAFRLPI
jgi:hypothetical protein